MATNDLRAYVRALQRNSNTEPDPDQITKLKDLIAEARANLRNHERDHEAQGEDHDE